MVCLLLLLQLSQQAPWTSAQMAALRQMLLQQHPLDQLRHSSRCMRALHSRPRRHALASVPQPCAAMQLHLVAAVTVSPAHTHTALRR